MCRRGALTMPRPSEDEWEPAVDPAELGDAMRAGYGRIIDFVTTPEFESVVDEMNELPPEERPDFVKDVLLDDDELASRGVTVPDDLVIQRSSFGDRRPTLFVVKTYLPEEFHEYWDNVNITFDNPEEGVEVRTGEEAWQLPLAPELERLVLSGRLPMETVEEHLSDPVLAEIENPSPVEDPGKPG